MAVAWLPVARCPLPLSHRLCLSVPLCRIRPPGGGGVDRAAVPGDNASDMATASEPASVKLICGLISARAEWLAAAMGAMTEAFGPVDLVSDVMDFDFTDYYDEQMGSPLLRQFVSFAELVSPEVLAEAKVCTNGIEADFAAAHPDGPARPVNLDPGYIAPAKLVLGSMKDFAHRVYLGLGVYGEVTLQYHEGRWDPLPWTFPDFASPRYHDFLTETRSRLREATKEDAT